MHQHVLPEIPRILGAQREHAGETINAERPDIRAALLPPPGTYLLGLAFLGRAVDFRDNDGNRAPLSLDGGIGGLYLGLGHVFEAEILGGRVGALLFAGYGRACLRVPELARSQCQNGFADSFAEVLWSRRIAGFALGGPAPDDPRRQWIPYGLTIAAGLGAVLPTGRYDRTDIAPLGLNTLAIVPSVAATWVSPPWLADGTEVSLRAYHVTYGRNTATDYQAGDMVVLDWAISERIGRVQLGPAGSFVRQLEPDRQAGRRGPSTDVTALGAVLALDLPEAGMFLSLKVLSDVQATWRLRQDRIGLRIGIRL
ncbi:transporter [Leptolyngbya sp. 15MV]|nr:transporter [Leptolyngbya sp. 15MV]